MTSIPLAGRTEMESGFHEDIAQIGVNSAINLIDPKKVVTQDDAGHVNCVKLIMLYFNTYGTPKYIATKQLILHLQVGRGGILSEHNFRNKVSVEYGMPACWWSAAARGIRDTSSWYDSRLT